MFSCVVSPQPLANSLPALVPLALGTKAGSELTRDWGLLCVEYSTMFDQARALDSAQKNSELFSMSSGTSVMAAVPETKNVCLLYTSPSPRD